MKEPERDRRREREREREIKEKKEGDEMDREKVEEMEAIKDRYLGTAKKKRIVHRLNERKFVFESGVSEDIAVDYNPI